MEGRVCAFIGHRKIKEDEKLKEVLKSTIEGLITEKGVRIFLFGSRSQFDDLCYLTVTQLKQKYSYLQRVAYTCKSEAACSKEEKEKIEPLAKEIIGCNILIREYEREIRSPKVWNAGKLRTLKGIWR